MSINPFDIKTMLLAKHAQHVVLIHFPIALFTAAVAFDFLAQWAKDRIMAAVAYCNLLAAAAFTLPVVASGLVAWQWALEGQKLKGILLLHLALGFLSTLLIWIAFCIHWRSHTHKRTLFLPQVLGSTALSCSFLHPWVRKRNDFLRHIWLECCGHLSAFEISGKRRVYSAGRSAALPHASSTPWRPVLRWLNGNSGQAVVFQKPAIARRVPVDRTHLGAGSWKPDQPAPRRDYTFPSIAVCSWLSNIIMRHK